MKLEVYDLLVFLLYCATVITTGVLISGKAGRNKTSNSYFFAGNSLPWYAIGSSVIAANISAEQFIGMSGSGYAMGITIASYEWLASIMLIMVAIWFLPVFINNSIYTMPQFIERRYDKRVKTLLSVLWILLFVFINLTSILYLGALALREIFGIRLIYAIAGLSLFAFLLTFGGGLRTIAHTDITQVAFLILGGLFTTWLALDTVASGQGPAEGLAVLLRSVPEKFHMILPRDDPNYKYMPGIKSIFGGIWIAVLITLPVPLALKLLFPSLPFLDNMVLSFLIISAQLLIFSLFDKNGRYQEAKLEITQETFRIKDPVFMIFTGIITAMLVFLYTFFW